MCDIADGYNDIEAVSHPRARVGHVCQGCGETIRPGDTYAVTRVLYDGHWDGWKHCLRCEAIHSHLLDKARESRDPIAIAPGLDCGLEYEDSWGVQPPPWIAALAFALPSDARE